MALGTSGYYRRRRGRGNRRGRGRTGGLAQVIGGLVGNLGGAVNSTVSEIKNIWKKKK